MTKRTQPINEPRTPGGEAPHADAVTVREQERVQATPAPGFRDLIAQLSEQLGHGYLPCHLEAREFRDFPAPDGVYPELGNSIITIIYKASRCSHLDAPVRPLPVFEALGQLRGQLVQSHNTDVDQIAFLERVGTHLREALALGEDPLAP